MGAYFLYKKVLIIQFFRGILHYRIPSLNLVDKMCVDWLKTLKMLRLHEMNV